MISCSRRCILQCNRVNSLANNQLVYHRHNPAVSQVSNRACIHPVNLVSSRLCNLRISLPNNQLVYHRHNPQNSHQSNPRDVRRCNLAYSQPSSQQIVRQHNQPNNRQNRYLFNLFISSHLMFVVEGKITRSYDTLCCRHRRK